MCNLVSRSRTAIFYIQTVKTRIWYNEQQVLVHHPQPHSFTMSVDQRHQSSNFSLSTATSGLELFEQVMNTF